jgi:hypothetical protein
MRSLLRVQTASALLVRALERVLARDVSLSLGIAV